MKVRELLMILATVDGDLDVMVAPPHQSMHPIDRVDVNCYPYGNFDTPFVGIHLDYPS